MIHCCMDRKQEIQNQIAELQRELAGIENGFNITIHSAGDEHRYGASAKSLDDADIIAAIEGLPSLLLRLFANQTIIVTCSLANYEREFYVTEKISHFVTPF